MLIFLGRQGYHASTNDVDQHVYGAADLKPDRYSIANTAITVTAAARPVREGLEGVG